MKNNDKGCLWWFGALVLAIAVLCVMSFITAGLALWLWNLIVIPVFAAPVLTYWQMYGIICLIHLMLPTASSSISRAFTDD